MAVQAVVIMQHIYIAVAGTYNVKLVVTSEIGCKDSITIPVTVTTSGSGGGGSTTLLPSFTVNNTNQCLSGNSFIFTNTTPAPPVGTTYLWTFGDGTTSTLSSPTKVYSTAGYHYVQMQATYNGVTYTASGQSVYTGASPIPSFTSSQISSLNYGFSNTSTIASGYINGYSWNFGDGSTGSGNYATHLYSSAGTYNVKLVVTSEIGCKDSITIPVTVTTSGSGGGGSTTLSPSFTVNNANQCLSGNSFIFTNTTPAPPVGTTYLWTFGDGTTSTLSSPTKTYSTAGYHYVQMQATYNGVTYTASGQSLYTGASPIPSFTSSQVSSLNYGFSNTSTIASGYINSYSWNFGDGSTGSGNYATHLYSSAGTYNVKLVLTSEIGCKDSITIPVTVTTSGSGGGGSTTLSPSFTVNNANQCLSGNNFVFTNTTPAPPVGTTYLWTFGDGTTSTLSSPTKTYSTVGYHYVQMQATYNGVTYTASGQSVYTGASPVPSFTSSQVSSLNYGFSNTSTIASGYINSYAWTFGDGSTGSGNYATHLYSSAGTYNVKLVLTSEIGCKDSITLPVTVTTSGAIVVSPSFIVNNINQCLSGNSFVFTNTTSSAPSGTTYSWNFGDGTTSILANPTHSYVSAGTYTVQLIATLNSQSYYYTLQAIVTATPTATIAAGTYCTGNAISVSTSATNIASIQWKNGGSVVGTNIPTWSTTYTTVAGTSAGTVTSFPNVIGATVTALSDPYAVYLDANKDLYIIDNGLSRVVKWVQGASTGTVVAKDVQITGLGFDKDGSLYTVDDIGNHVLRWNVGAVSGVVVAGGNGGGSAANQLNNPGGQLFIDNSYNVYVNDKYNHRVQMWALGATNGVTVAGGNGQGNAANQLNYPTSIFVDAIGTVYVVDANNFRIQKWTSGAITGTTVAGGNGSGVNANQLYQPRAVFVDAFGTMYINAFDFSSNNTVIRWEAGASSGISILATTGSPLALSETGGYVDVTTGCIYIPKVTEDIVAKYCSYSTSTSFTPSTAGSYTAVVNTFGGCGYCNFKCCYSKCNASCK